MARNNTVRFLSPRISGAAVLGIALAWVYWPTLVDAVQRWTTDSRYSHGYVVPVFAAYLLWSRRQLLPKEGCRPHKWGLALLSLGLAIRFSGAYLFVDWLSAISLLPCLAGFAVLLGGWGALRWSWPAIAFLAFMLPLPYRIETALANPLQSMATVASTYVLQTVGFVAYAEGHVIHLDDIRLGVVEACSGLSMLMIFFALSTALTLVIRRSWVEKGLILLSAIPIALIANVTRITVTGILHKTAGSAMANLVFHDLAGWLMMILALVLMGIELRVLSWVLAPQTESQTPLVFRGVYAKSAKGAGDPSVQAATAS